MKHRPGLRARIALAAVAATGCALLSVPLLVGPQLRESYIEQTREALLADARLMARVAQEPLARSAAQDELDALIDEAARESRVRATLVGLDGAVLADSAVSGDALRNLDNHGRRPEVVAALQRGSGTSIRLSATVHDELLYAAVPVYNEGRLLAISRVALSLEGLEAHVAELRESMLIALILAFAIAVLASAILSRSVMGPLHEMMEVARGFATGDLRARIRISRNDELGELARILNSSADQLQERLAESQRDRARTAAMLSAMEEGVLAVDHEGRVLVANDALRAWLSLEDPVGRHYAEAIPQREIDHVLEEVLRRGRRSSVEVELLDSGRAFAVAAVPFPGADPAPHGAVLTFHDVTERRRNDEVRRDFVANASHELRTPLTSIRGFVEALEDGALDDPQTAGRFLGKIRTHSDRMAALVEDLLELSRLESGDHAPSWEEVAPDQIVEEVLTSFSGRAARKKLTLTRSGPGSPIVVTDPERLLRILENLVDNAVKYTPPGGNVEIFAGSARGGEAVLEVRDDGPGIPSEHLTRLFERFYRVDKARSRDLGGTGLGLSIVRHLANRMGASVKVASEVGRGTCFTVSLPADPLVDTAA